MARKTLLSHSVVLALILITGCGKDDDKVLNSLSIVGNENLEINGEYTPVDAHYNGTYEIQCVTTTYGSYIWIDLSSDAVLQIEFVLPSDASPIPLGTITPSGGECQEGFYAQFYPAVGKKIAGMALTSGTVTIAKDGDKYDVDLDLGFHSLDGGGTLKGNFYGSLPLMQNGIK